LRTPERNLRRPEGLAWVGMRTRVEAHMTDGFHSPSAPTTPQVGKYDPSKLNFGTRLHDAGFHPVLVFGTSESGKSMMLLSLLSYGAANADIAASLSNSRILPREDLNAEKYHSEAAIFWKDDIGKFRARELINLTQRKDPLFIPIEIKRKRSDQLLKFAFLEGDGEWYRRNLVNDQNRDNFRPIPELKWQIEQVLNSYVGGVSIIFICPTYEAHPQKPVQESRDSLAALIPMVWQIRKNINPTDNLLLMLSMWDGRYGPSNPHGHFYDASADVALDALGGPQSDLWTAFSEHVEEGGAAKAMMPYSAHWINNKVMLDNAQHKPIFDRFNRTLWNWLYGNATQSLTSTPGDRLGRRKTLFPDVMVPDPRPIRWHEWLTWRFILSRIHDDTDKVSGDDKAAS